MLLIYSAEVKQYSGDVFAAVLLTLTAFELRSSRYSKSWTVTAAIAALSIVWFSDTSTIVLGGLGLGLVLLVLLEREAAGFRAAAILAPVWCLAILANQIGARRRMVGGTAEVMHSTWKAAFMPFPPRSKDETLWLWRALSDIYAISLGMKVLYGASLIIAATGIWFLWRRGRRDVVALMFGPVVVALVASAAQLYPFTGRFTLFLLPAFVVALAAGVGFIARAAPKYPQVAQAVLFVVLVNPPAFVRSSTTPAWLREEIRPVLSHVAAKRQPGDKIYVYWGGAPATAFYGPRYGLKNTDWVAGGLHGDKADGYLPEFDQFRGSSRLWVIFAHSRAPGVRDGILRHLDSLGVKRMSEEYPPPESPRDDAAAFLYDLRRSQR